MINCIPTKISCHLSIQIKLSLSISKFSCRQGIQVSGYSFTENWSHWIPDGMREGLKWKQLVILAISIRSQENPMSFLRNERERKASHVRLDPYFHLGLKHLSSKKPSLTRSFFLRLRGTTACLQQSKVHRENKMKQKRSWFASKSDDLQRRFLSYADSCLFNLSLVH